MATLAGKHALVTGASSGIGAAIARRFAAAGATVSLAARSGPRLAAVKASLGAGPEGDARHHVYEVDVSKADGVEGLVTQAVKDIGRLDVLVNAAGTTFGSLLVRGSPDHAQQVVNTNLMGAVYTCQYAAPHLRKTSGSIINISSILARKGARGASVYAATKAGVLGLTHSLAVELGPWDIRVNAIAPGYIDTSMVTKMHENFKRLSEDERRKLIPLGRYGAPEEVADAALFLALNGYANNCILNLDGGLSAL